MLMGYNGLHKLVVQRRRPQSVKACQVDEVLGLQKLTLQGGDHGLQKLTRSMRCSGTQNLAVQIKFQHCVCTPNENMSLWATKALRVLMILQATKARQIDERRDSQLQKLTKHNGKQKCLRFFTQGFEMPKVFNLGLRFEMPKVFGLGLENT